MLLKPDSEESGMRTWSDSVNKIDAVSDVQQSIGISVEFEISQLLGVPLKTHVSGPRLILGHLGCDLPCDFPRDA